MIIAQRVRKSTTIRSASTITESSARADLNRLADFVNRDPLPDNVEMLNVLERAIKKSELYANWLKHPVTKDMVLTIVKQIDEVNADLLAGKKLPKDTVLRRDEWKKILAIFDPARAGDSGVSHYIDFQTKRMREYYGE